jgi:hypothetical protein
MWRGNSFYMPSLGYWTPATKLTKKDCEEIQRPVVDAILPKLGIARPAPRAIVFGTSQFGGLGLTHLAVLQGHTLIQYLVTYKKWRHNWEPYSNDPGIYTTIVWVSWQSTGARLQQICSTAHKYKLDNRSMGVSTYVQCYGRGRWVMTIRSQQTVIYCDHGNVGIVREVHEQRTEGN